MPKQTQDHSTGIVVILLILLAVVAAIASTFFYSRLWATSSYTSRPVTVIKTKEVNTNTAATEEVHITAPEKNSQVTTPIAVSGTAPGTWFFEGSFPVRLEDLQGNILTQTYTQAQGEWMTEGPVEFTSSVEYSVSEETSAVLVFQPDDPSGLGVTEEYRHPVLLLP
ncbi:MAG: Gmad2 immunoglobulin-like domain-containing protein [Patescibacteria group bacterium]|mgnify:CR=1 FL=1